MAAGTKLDWKFFPGCTGLTQPLFYDDRVAARRSGRPMSTPEIGCYASHFKLWEWLAGSEYDQAIIFEDDILVDWTVMEQLADRNLSQYGINLLRLFATHPFDYRTVKYRALSNLHLVRAAGTFFGAQAYVLTRDAARTLMKNYSVVAAPSDWILGRYWEHGILNYCMFPFPVIDRRIPSVIGEDRYAEPPLGPADHMARLGWRLRDRLMRAYAEGFVIEKYPFGPLRDSGEAFLTERS
jgi:glycosyl transferase family 25